MVLNSLISLKDYGKILLLDILIRYVIIVLDFLIESFRIVQVSFDKKMVSKVNTTYLKVTMAWKIDNIQAGLGSKMQSMNKF